MSVHCRHLSSCLSRPQAYSSQHVKMSHVCSEKCLRKRSLQKRRKNDQSNEPLQWKQWSFIHGVGILGNNTKVCCVARKCWITACLMLGAVLILQSFNLSGWVSRPKRSLDHADPPGLAICWDLNFGFWTSVCGFQLASRVASG